MPKAAAPDPKELSAKAKEVSRILRGLAHPVRLRIFCRLAEGPATVQELQETCGLSQAGTSQFLARLRAEGQVEARREGRSVSYSLANTKVTELIKAITKVYCPMQAKSGRHT